MPLYTKTVFFSHADKKDSQIFHKAMASGSFDVLNQLKSSRIKILVQRILHRNFSDSMKKFELTEGVPHIQRLKSDKAEDQIVGFKNDAKFNLTKAKAELLEIRQGSKELSQDDTHIINWLESYLAGL